LTVNNNIINKMDKTDNFNINNNNYKIHKV